MFNALALISVIAVMLTLKLLVGILPYVLASAVRWKESINIEASVRLSRDRDISALVLVIPFCLTVFRFRIYDPMFMSNLTDNVRLLAIIGIFILYVLLRKAASMLARPHRIPQKTYAAVIKSANTFFILLTFVLMGAGSIASFCNASPETTRSMLLWLSCLIYGLYLIRKVQIFASSYSIFTGFLYLCALEILPTGIIVVSGMIF